jgi:hypothetical protein
MHRAVAAFTLIAGTLAPYAIGQDKQQQPPQQPVVAKPVTEPQEAPKPQKDNDLQITEWRPEAVDVLRKEAGSILHLLTNIGTRKVAAGVTWLPVIDSRTVYMDQGRQKAYTVAEFEKLKEEEKAGLKPVEFDGYRFYYTNYGSPMAYMRPLDIVAEKIGGPLALRNKKVMDFGYGTIGHLRMMASQNMEVVGVEVDPMLRALYSDPEDQGKIPGVGLEDVPPAGHLTLVHGSWPKDPAVVKQVGGGFDIITSKNTLKNGFIHPEQPVDKRRMVDLGVPDEQFVAKVHEALKPGGYFLIYNICPAQKKEPEKYIPWADGRCPFPREMMEKAGFEVLEYNKDDSAIIRQFGTALEWNKGPRPMDLENDLFAEYTLARKKPAAGGTTK